ncbi:MAG: TonB-dependent receptor [Prevotella sp.]|nr:TonB-dependent receptor [Prevotella sp.]
MNKTNICKSQVKGKMLSLCIVSALVGACPQQLFATQTVNTVTAAEDKANGVVVDNNGDPIIGASIVVKDSHEGAITNLDGRFSLVGVQGRILVVSYVGFQTQEVRATSNMRIVLQENTKALNEVVVVGYGTQRKEELTSSVMSVKSDKFIQGATTDAANLIRGKVAGLSVINTDGNPLSTAQIMLRGVTTLKSSAAPLIIIDGVPGALNDVSPNDIEQIDVLKDGSAAAIYGTRGTNGVIIITTKRSKGEMRPTIDVNSYISTQQITRKLDMMSASQYRQKVQEGVPGAIDHNASTNWLDEILQTPLNQTYSVSLKGGSSQTNYIASVDYTSNEGIVKRSNVNVLYPRMNVTHRMWGDLLKLEAQLSGYHRTYDIPYNNDVYNSAILYNPTFSVKNDDGTWNENGSNPMRFNPVALLEETKGENKDTKIKMYGKATLSPIQGLSLSLLGSKEIDNFFAGYYETMQHKSTTMDGRNGYASRTTARTQNDLLEITAQYNNRFGLNNVNALLGYSWNQYNYQYASMSNWEFPSDDFTYNNMGQGAALSKGRAGESSTQNMNKLVGWFGRINYNYANRYFLSASVRYEGSSKFGADHKWGTFPAVSAGWNLAGEDFMKPVEAVSTLKLRAGYGVTGTVPADPYMSLNRLSMGGYGYYRGEWINQLKPSGNANPDLRWEKKKELNVGLDFGFLQDRITGSIDFYRRTTDDLIWDYSVPVPPYVSTVITANAGTIRNTGLEVNLTAIPVQTKDFEWTTNVNFSTNSNKLVSLSNDEFIAGSYTDLNQLVAPIQQPSHRIEEGKSIGNFYGYKSVGVDENGHWLIEGADGQSKPIAQQDATDKQVIGNGLPDFYLNFNNTLRYKQFDLNVTMRGAFGFQILNSPEMFYGSPVGLGNGNVMNSAFEPKYGRALANDQELQYVSYFVQNGDYWKIDNVTLGWSPDLSRINWIQKLRLYASISNLATITGYKGIDPEVSVSGLTPGIDNLYRYPAARTYTLGISLTF